MPQNAHMILVVILSGNESSYKPHKSPREAVFDELNHVLCILVGFDF